MDIILLFFAIKYNGDWDAIYEALDKKERVTLEQIKETEELIKKENWKFMTILDPEYPKKLKEAFKPPFVFWYEGDKKIFKKNFVAVTGNQIDKNTKDRIKKFIPKIISKYSLVTSSYPGVDEMILKESENTARLFILSGGINSSLLKYKPTKTDLVFSEYPPNTKTTKENARNRNRLVASFANFLVLVTSLKNGPINNLVSNFLNLGKEVYCFPGDGSEKDGNSELIKQGANLITGINDISN